MRATALKRRLHTDIGGTHYVLAGPAGVVEYLCDDGGHGPIRALLAHAPRPTYDDDEPSPHCPYLEGACYPQVAGLAADTLAARWEAAGRDDAVIWATLADYYTEALTTGRDAAGHH